VKKKSLLLLSVISGILLTPAWYEWGHGFFLFFALIPLLFIEEYLCNNKTVYGSGSFFKYSFISFLIWNTATTWWIVNSTLAGVILAIIINTFMSTLVVWFFHIIKRRLGKRFGYFSLILFWITWEYFYLNAEISWPWLVLGNGFAYNIRLIQWYEFTGALGGTFWVLIVNIVLFRLIFDYPECRSQRRYFYRIILAFILIFLPVTISLIRFYTYKEIVNPKKVVVIQPNIDPYQKFVSIPSADQTMVQINEANKAAVDGVDYFLGPETSINNNIWMDGVEKVEDIQIIRDFLENHPGAAYITGIQCYRRLEPGEQPTSISRLIQGTDIYYDVYNAAVQLDSSGNVPFYFKSKLVTGVEKMPYAKYLKFLEKLTLRLGGTMRGWGSQEERSVFYSAKDSTGVSPVICYESVYGEFVTEYVKNGASLLFILTNDGWWGDTPGYRQHNAYASLRAIETRRSIARSANTGISSIINQKGEVLQSLPWWERGAILGTLNKNDEITFYVQNGDYLGRVAIFFSFLVVLYYISDTLLNIKLLKSRRKCL